MSEPSEEARPPKSTPQQLQNFRSDSKTEATAETFLELQQTASNTRTDRSSSNTRATDHYLTVPPYCRSRTTKPSSPVPSERHSQMWNYPSNQLLPEGHRPPMLRCSSKLPRPPWKKHTDITSEGERHSQQKNFYNSKPRNLLTHSLLILLIQSPLHIHFLNMAPPAYLGGSHGAGPLRPPRPRSM